MPARQRKHTRLPQYDYGQAGLYFVTCVVLERRCLFGEVLAGGMLLSEAGQIALEEMQKTPTLRPTLSLDTCVVMPNHVHLLLAFSEGHPGSSFTATRREGMPDNARAGTLGAVVGAFKSASTRRIRAAGLASFGWQRNYHEHVVQTGAALERIRVYIHNNPQRWLEDAIHPDVNSPW